MSHRWFYLLILNALAAVVASTQQNPPDLKTYLKLTDAQWHSISDLNSQFSQYAGQQLSAYYDWQSKATAALTGPSPDPGEIGDDYARMEMIRRDYSTQLAQLQSKVAAVLNPDQAVLVSGLLSAARLQPLIAEAQCVYMEQQLTFAYLSAIPYAISTTFGSSTSTCQIPPFPTALGQYLNLGDAQIAAIENAIRNNQDYVSRQALKIAELQNEITDLTSADTIDAARLGADYIAIQQIQNDESTQTGQLTSTVRSVLTDQQQPQLQALDNAMQLNFTVRQAESSNVLVLPADLQCGNELFPTIPIATSILAPRPATGILSTLIPLPNAFCVSGFYFTLPTSIERQ
jgi:Spy/CpxP family protein refolding chaperone